MLICFALVLSLICAGICVMLVQMALITEICIFLAVTLGVFLLFALFCFLLVWIPSLFADPDQPFEQDSKYFRTILRLYAPAVFSILLTKIQVTGKEKMPKSGRFLLVCNHIDNLDSPVIYAAFPNAQLGFLAKKETREFFLIGKLMGRVGCKFLDRENDRAALRVIVEAIQNIRDDKLSIAAFPEGGVIEDGRKLHHFRPGVFKLATKSGVPIVVCTIRGTTTILTNICRLKPSFVDLRVLDVVAPEQYAGLKTPELAERIYGIMRADLGPEADGSL